jgi:hypothetical protein
MKRILYQLCLTSLFIVSLLFVGNAQQPVLEKVSVDTMITISWLYDKDIDSVTIYKCTQNCNIEDNFSSVVKLEMSDLEWIDAVASPTSQNYYCIGWEGSGKSKPQNNMVLKAIPALDGCPNSISLSWNPYINMLDTLDCYHLLYRKTEVDTSFFELLTLTNETLYTAKLLENITAYEFVIQAINRTGTISVFSNIVQDRTGTVIDEPVEITVTRVSVWNDVAIEIHVVTDDVPDPQNLKNLFLLRGSDYSSNYNIIDSLPYSPNNEYYFMDKNVDPRSKLYYYQAIADQQCKANDTSNILTNILLKGRRVEGEKYKDSIYFAQIGVDLSKTYDLLVNGNPYSTMFQLTASNNRCLVDVERFMKEGSELVFQIVSDKDSSNTLVIPHEPIVDFPTAFYPQGFDEDRMFYPIIYFPSKNNYLFIIYNRWGVEMYRSSEPPPFHPTHPDFKPDTKWGWDGTFQGQDCPAGIYAYKLSYSYNDGKGKYSKSGSFVLIR